MKLKKTKISLKEFILTGKFGPVEFGMSGEDLEHIFGKPDYFGCGPPDEYQRNSYNFETDESKSIPAQKKANKYHAQIWMYGDFEFHFSEKYKSDNLFLIFTDYFSKIKGGKRIKIDPWILERGLKKEKLLGEFHNNNIKYKYYYPFKNQKYENGEDVEDECCRIITSSGINFQFLTEKYAQENNDQPGLVSISKGDYDIEKYKSI